MSKHGSFYVKVVIVVSAILLMCILPPRTGMAEVPVSIHVTIEDTEMVPLGSTIDIPITIFNNAAIELAGFELLIDFDPNLLAPVDVQPGQILTDCLWEYFTYRYDAGVGLRIVALADINDGDNHPDCLIGNTSGTIAVMTFNVSTDQNYECLDFPVQFIWRDCADNAFTDASGLSLFLSRYVYDWGSHDPIHADDVFPTYKGAPDECLSGPKYTLERRIDFTSGRVEILCEDSIDSRGDINMNDIAYEIADYVLFQNYFLYGLDVFTIDVDQQSANSEVNGDGIELTMRDLIYIWRVIIGDALPLPNKAGGISSDTAVFIQDMDAGTVRLFYPDTLAGAYLRFIGDIFPTYVGDMAFAYHLDTGYTHILISPPHTSEPRGGFVEGQLFTYTGGGTLDSVEVADFYDALILTEIQINEGEPACGDINYDSEINIADLVYLIGYIFKGGAPPYSLEAADVNCDGKINITDIIYLVEYLFRGGPIPCADCPR